jgi:FlaA1/EpsC-like NDP-sugar epimerase
MLDAVCVVAGYGMAEVIRFRDRAPAHYWRTLGPFLLLVLVLTLFTNHLLGLYRRMWRHAGVEEARHLLLSAAVVVGLLAAFYPLGRMAKVELVPLTVIVVGGVFSALGMGLLRFHSRLFAWQRGLRRLGLRVAVVGSRDTGAAAIREMLRCPGAGLVPVAVFDDDTAAHGLSVHGVPVVGGIEDIPKAAGRFTLQQVLLAIPSPPRQLTERVLRASEQAGISVKVLPGVRDLVSGTAQLAALREAREPRIEDLLGRIEVATDLDAVRACLAGHRVLVTGAGGSIGSVICRQIADLKPELLILLDHDETHLHDAAATVPGPCEHALVDITDRPAVFAAFERYRPQVVFHAAAHKHVPILEEHPVEAARTNVFGTVNVVEASIHVGVTRFVQISSDKAVRPSSIMGATKHLAEQIVMARSPHSAAYCAVRFGNVLGSRGSVIPTFARQIAMGGPVTVTDARMTRFFMSVEEAVQLVLQASVLADGGEIFMLEMGEQVRILDLAERMIRLSGYRVGADISIQIIGRRPGEKLCEELFTDDENVLPTGHPYIRRVIPAGLPLDGRGPGLELLANATVRNDATTVRALLFGAVAPNGKDPTDAARNSAGAGVTIATTDHHPDGITHHPDSVIA